MTKGYENADLRQKCDGATIPQAEYRGRKVPDTNMRFNEETGHNEHGEIDWDEFWRVVKGGGKMNRDRIADRKKAWDDGAWVREAALAHAEKRRARQEATLEAAE